MRQAGFATSYFIAALAVLLLLLAGAGVALKKQIENNGEQRARLAVQAAALNVAEQLRQSTEQALLSRERDIAKITATNRRLQHDVTKALQGDACAAVPIPPALDKLLCERAPGACKSVPPGDAAGRTPTAALGG